MNKMLFNFALVLLVCFPVGTFSQYKSAGSVNYPHLLLNYEARSAGLAGVSVALPGGVEMATGNPAVIASADRMQAYIGHQTIAAGVWCSPIGFLRPNSFGVLAITMQGVSSGDIKEIIDQGGNPAYTGKVAHNEYFTPALSYARTFLKAKILAGMSVKGMYQRIVTPAQTYSSKAFGMDFGIQYRVNNDRFITGVVIRNAGYEFSSFTEDENYPVPLVFEAGISYIPKYFNNVRICADINKTRGEYINFEPGLEFEFYPKTLFLRLGFPFSQRDIKEQLGSVSDDDENYAKSNWAMFAGGVGVQFKLKDLFVKFDLALQFLDNVDNPAMIYSAVVEF